MPFKNILFPSTIMLMKQIYCSPSSSLRNVQYIAHVDIAMTINFQ